MGKIELIHGDCMDYMRECEDNAFDLAIVDPPYGSNALDGSKTAKKFGINRGDNWDCYRPKGEYFRELLRVSKNQIIWGGNYFISDLKDTKCLIVLDKTNIPDSFKTMSPIETAWTSFDKPSAIYRLTTVIPDRQHPAQKPLGLYNLLLANYAEPGQRILDTHLGSGSSAIAAHYFGVDFVGIEIDEDYYKAAVERFNNETRQTDIFSTPAQESETGGISDTDRIQDGKGPRQGEIL